MTWNAIVLAGGTGTRASLDYPKQFVLIGGKPMIMHSLELLQSMEEIDKIIVVYVSGYESKFNQYMTDYGITKACLTPGGPTRQASVQRGLDLVASNEVLVHEAARPFISRDFIQEILYTNARCVVPVIPIPYTVVQYSIEQKQSPAYPNRSTLKNVQLPQKFHTESLRSAHSWGSLHSIQDATDDSSLLANYLNASQTYKPDNPNDFQFIAGLEQNIKITSPLDIELGKVIYDANSGHYGS